MVDGARQSWSFLGAFLAAFVVVAFVAVLSVAESSKQGIPDYTPREGNEAWVAVVDSKGWTEWVRRK